MLRTKFEGADLPHRFMWEIVEEQAKRASELERDWSKPALVAMVFAFHAVEAYLNFVGGLLAPEVWQDERDYFRKEPYRGWHGKLRKVMELVELKMSEEARPLKTVFELKRLRDAIAHGKPEKLAGDVVHDEETEAPFAVSELRSMFTPKRKVADAVSDVEELLNRIHSLAKGKVKEQGFGDKALQGPSQCVSWTTTLSR